MARQKGQGTIYQDKKSDKYYIRFRINGKQIIKSLKTKSEKQAIKNAAEFRREHQIIINAKSKEEIAVQIQKARDSVNVQKGIALQEGYSIFYKSPGRKQNTAESTLKNYERIYNLFLAWIKKQYPTIHDAVEISKNEAHEYALYLWGTYKTYKNKQMSANTYNYHIGALQTIFDIITENKNVWKSIERKEENKKSHKLLSTDDIARIFDVFLDTNFSILNRHEMELLVYLGVFTGLRLKDCVNIKRECIRNGVIKVTPFKTKGFKKKVIIPLSDRLLSKIYEFISITSGDYLLPGVQERYDRNPDGVKHDLKKIFIKAGIKPDLEGRKNKGLKYSELETEITGFHCFRHTFITECVKNNMDIVRLSTMTGDSIKTLQKYYIHLKDEVMKKEADKLPNF